MRIISPAMITLIMLIVIGGLVLAYIGKSLFNRPEPPAAEVATRLVPMASTDIPAGTLITSQHLVNGRLRTDKLTRDTILNSNAIVGRYALEDIKQAQPILTSQLYAPKQRPPLDLEPGMQAVTISLADSTSIVDGLIKPGNYVDVHLTISDNNNDNRYRGGFTMTMFKGVRLLALNRLTQPADINSGTNTVTLEVTPKQSNILLQAKQHGELTISYNPEGRGSGGVDVAAEDRAYFDEILGLPPIPEPEKPFRLELFHGTSRSLIGFGDDRTEWGGGQGSNRGWVEQPGWAPPRGGVGGGRGGYGGGYGRGNYWGSGFQGSQDENRDSGGNGPSAQANPQNGSGAGQRQVQRQAQGQVQGRPAGLNTTLKTTAPRS